MNPTWLDGILNGSHDRDRITVPEAMRVIDRWKEQSKIGHTHHREGIPNCEYCDAQADVNRLYEQQMRGTTVSLEVTDEPEVPDMGEPMEVYEDWEFEIDSMSAEDILRTWRQQNVGQYSHGAAKTKYLLDRMTEIQREDPASWDQANRLVTWGNDTFLKPNELGPGL